MSDDGDKFFVPTLAVVGVGLIGGSLALALKKNGCVGRVVGVGRSRESLERAMEVGAVDSVADTVASDVVAGADVIVLATPVVAMAEVLKNLAPALTDAAVVTDTGSVKAGVINAAAALGARARRFVPAHPVAGKERSGVTAADADLFRDHNVALTPTPATDADAADIVKKMWSATGARVVTMDAAAHDRILSLTSHLPHALAYAMVDFFSKQAYHDAPEMTAGGFYDFTRTASSDPEMWRDIFLMNRGEVIKHLDDFAAHIKKIRAHIDAGDGDALEKMFAAAKKVRATLSERRKL